MDVHRASDLCRADHRPHHLHFALLPAALSALCDYGNRLACCFHALLVAAFWSSAAELLSRQPPALCCFLDRRCRQFSESRSRPAGLCAGAFFCWVFIGALSTLDCLSAICGAF